MSAVVTNVTSLRFSNTLAQVTPAGILCVARHSETLFPYYVAFGEAGKLVVTPAAPEIEPSLGRLQALPFVATHRHYKGDDYEALGIAQTETEQFVVYRHGGADLSAWIRPAEMFCGIIEDGRIRFVPIAN